MANKNSTDRGAAVRPAPRRVRAAVRLWLVAALMLLAALWSVTLLQLRAEKKIIEKHVQENAVLQARAYANQLTRTLHQLDQIAAQIAFDWTVSHGTLQLEQMPKAGLYAAAHLTSIAIYDAHGKALTATVALEQLEQGGATAYLRAHRDHRGDALQVSLGRGATTLAPSVHLSRRLERNGSFAGIIVIAAAPDYFADFHDIYNLGKLGMLAMAAPDGTLYSVQAGRDVAAGAAVPHASASMLASGSGAMLAPASQFGDRQARFLAWETVPGHALVALAGLAESESLQPYAEIRSLYFGIAGIGSAALLLFMLILGVVSRRMAARQRLSDGVRDAYRMASNGTNDGFFILSAIRAGDGGIVDFELVDCNQAGADYLGRQRADVVGLRLAESPSPHYSALVPVYAAAMQAGFVEEELDLPDGNPMNLRSVRRRLVRSGEQLAVTVQNTGHLKDHQQDLLRLANEDALTGLPNRHWIVQHLPTALQRAGASASRLALLFIGLDGFKAVNEIHGHGAGDQVLREAAERLRGILPPGAHVVRLGADEFVVILDPLPNDAKVARIAARVNEAFEDVFSVDEGRHKVGVSVGASVYPRDGLDTETLLKNADIAMHAVKLAGGGHFRVYAPELYQVISGRREIEQSLIEALEYDQFVVYYQPRIEARSGALCSMEALVRWLHPQRGLVPPLEFIPVAESSGLIGQLGDVVIEKVCRQLAQWQAQGTALVPVSINVSAHQFGRGDLHLVVAAALARHGIAASLIELEITESAMMGEQDAIVTQLAAIRAQGVKLLVDDFGTGYSSLSQLQKFAMDGLKIDRAFTSELGKSEQGEIFVRAILSMAHALGMSVVAEGVETEEQMQILRALSCNELQGYLISRPVPASQMLELMEQQVLVAPSYDAYAWR